MNLQLTHLKQNSTLLLFMFMVFLLPLLYIEPLHNPSSLPRYILVAFIAGLSLLSLSISILRKRQLLQWHPSQIIAIIFLLFASLSYSWSIEEGNSLIEIMNLSSFVILFLVATQIKSITNIKNIAFVAVISGGMAALIGISQNFGFNPFDFRTYVMASTFVYKNHAALYFDLIIPIAFFLILTVENKTLKMLTAICFGLCLGFIIESRTRGSYLALSIILLIVIIFWLFNRTFRGKINNKIRQNYIFIFLAVLTCLMAIVPPGENDTAWERKSVNYQTTGDGPAQSAKINIDQSSMDRLLFYRNSLGIIQENPIIGTGYGTFWKAFRMHMNRPYVIQRSNETLYLMRLHNDILQFFTELGLLGGLIIVLFFATVIIAGTNFILKQASNDNHLFIIAGLLLSLIASLVHAIVDFPFHKPSSASLIWLWSGLLVSASITISANRTISLKSRLITSALIGFASIYVIINTLFYISYCKDNHYFYLAEKNIKSKNCNDAIVNIDKAIRAFGLYHTTHLERINIHIGCNKIPQDLFNVLNEELRRDDTNTRALLERAELFLANGYLQQAEKDYRKVIFILPHRPSGKIGVARVMLKNGETDKAIEQLHIILKEHPRNKIAQKLLEDTLQSVNNLQR